MTLLNPDEKQIERNEFYYSITRNIAFISLLFCIIVGIIIIANFIRLETDDPLSLPELEKLITQSQSESENESLKKAIRELDMLNRRAYFSGRAFNDQGTYLLLGSAILFLVALKFMSEFKKKVPFPGKFEEAKDNPKFTRILQKSLLGVGIVLILSALILPRIFHSNIHSYLEEIKRDDSKEIEHIYASEQEKKKNWPGFRGYHSLGIAYATNIPGDWDGKSMRNILWKIRISKPGFSSPVVWSNRVFITGADEESRDIYCVDADEGVLLWAKQVKMPGAVILEISEDTGTAAPTMTTDGKYVFAIFATGELVCLDFEGNIIWQKKLKTPENHYGHSSSLISYKNLLLVQYDHAGGAKLIAFDTSTGKVKWSKKRKVGMSWTSPVMIDSSSGLQVVLVANPLIVSYEPETGKVLWQMEEVISGEIGPSAAYEDDIVFAVNQYSKLAAIDINTRKVIWEFEDDLPDASSPVAVDGLFFMPTSYGIVTCFEGRTGKKLWDHEFDKGSYASPIAVEGKIYLMDKKGVMRIFKSSRTFEFINSPELGEASTTTPAVMNSRLYIRGDNHLFCIKEANK